MPPVGNRQKQRAALVLDMSKELLMKMVEGRGKVEADMPKVCVDVVVDLVNRTLGQVEDD